MSARKTREEEVDWLAKQLVAMETDRTIVIVALFLVMAIGSKV